jgi:hypothetical protein
LLIDRSSMVSLSYQGKRGMIDQFVFFRVRPLFTTDSAEPAPS